MKKFKTINQGTKEWYKTRYLKITSSSSQTVLKNWKKFIDILYPNDYPVEYCKNWNTENVIKIYLNKIVF